MRKQIFKAICDRLAEKTPDVAFIDIWNDNVNVLNGGAAFPLPAVFVEFETIEWRQQGNSARMGDIAGAGPEVETPAHEFYQNIA